MEQVPVYTSTYATDSEIASVESALSQIGYSANPDRIIPSQGVGEVVLIVIGLPVSSFISAFSSAAGKDAWERLKTFRYRLGARPQARWKFWTWPRSKHEVQLLVRPEIQIDTDVDPSERAAMLLGWIPSGDTSSELMIPAGLPDEAYKKLFALNLDGFNNHFIGWNPDTEEWEVRSKAAPKPPSDD